MTDGAYAAIFDLDGVLTSTSARHEESWRDAAARFGFPVTNESLMATRSVPRATSLAALLAQAGVELDQATRDAVMAFKNVRYKELIAGLKPTDAFPGAREALMRCRDLGMRIGVASASMNSREVLERLELLDLVQHVADPREAAPKPSAEIYGISCAALSAFPGNAICIEDGALMIANLRAEGMYTVGVGDTGLGAHEHVRAIADWDAAATLSRLSG
ncbi:MAG: HAD hydrolase-like protein [Hyphomonadaceae bacterium]|nr:HAD hydrolase-like protein [Hyphomonadaceae bacterium]